MQSTDWSHSRGTDIRPVRWLEAANEKALLLYWFLIGSNREGNDTSIEISIALVRWLEIENHSAYKRSDESFLHPASLSILEKIIGLNWFLSNIYRYYRLSAYASDTVFSC